MKPINAEEIVRVFNGWLEEADSLAEREAIECCIDHIQDAPAVSQQELRSYMLPWFSPFAAPWCGKIDHIREEAYNTGYSEAEAQRASNPAPGKTLPQLLEQLDAGECKGIKSATAYKIAEFAREQGYLE